MSCGVSRRGSSGPVWLWLWYRLAAVALIEPLAWDPTYDAGAALKSRKKKKKTSQRTIKIKTNPKVSRRKEIIKIRGEINEIETRKSIEKSMKLRSDFLENIDNIDKPLARLRERTQNQK